MPANVALEKKQENVNIGTSVQFSCPARRTKKKVRLYFHMRNRNKQYVHCIYFCN